jgi:hypothetical protein
VRHFKEFELYLPKQMIEIKEVWHQAKKERDSL